MTPSINSRAMLCRVVISKWTNRKYDKPASDVVANNFGTSHKIGRYNKMLIPNDKDIKKISQAASQLRMHFYENTLPWGQDNARLLPSANYMTFMADYRKLKSEFEAAVYAFVNNYQNYVTEAQTQLNGMFNAADYPGVSEIVNYYSVDCIVEPLPNIDDFRVSLGDDEIEMIRRDLEERQKQAQEGAMHDLWTRIYEAVKHVSERLSDPENIFRDSILGNIKDLCQLLPKLNITDDAQLAALGTEIENKLCCYTPNALRKYDTHRREVAQAANELLETLSAKMS